MTGMKMKMYSKVYLINFLFLLDYIYGDTIFIKDEKNVRLYKSYDLNRNFMNIGYIPSHTSLFLKKKFMI